MKPGDLLRCKNGMVVGLGRVYTDLLCDSWETHMKKDEVVMLLERQRNQFDQDVLKVLFPRGVRWLYQEDVKVIG